MWLVEVVWEEAEFEGRFEFGEKHLRHSLGA
jgi:hypothetical protein